MAESGLSLNREDLREAIGFYLGYGADYSAYSTDQLAVADKCVDAGLRMFYSPPPIQGERGVHTWSFLTPVNPLSLVEDVVDYDLWDDFGGLVGKLYLSADDDAWSEIENTNIARILALRSRDGGSANGRPRAVAVNVIPSTGESPTRYSLAIWPKPSQSYTLQVQYNSNPYHLSSTAVYPLGGQPHAETLREACLAAAEINVNDERGLHYTMFMERLVASVHYDRKAMGPKSLGYNGDKTSMPRMSGTSFTNNVTYNGTLYDGT